ncbi:hypothetical protein KUTeg_013565 [Tegillarca granosa]|uniref:Uncharacterized protein n=1 Tax=Tegillarca granosa TaxID=220873 RepID=A0ABQ9EU26_TEGGR|nr:hypothetical protein KUTeg_013565 [Tegillarca granosa]
MYIHVYGVYVMFLCVSDQLRFVSHFYDDGKPNSYMTPISTDAREKDERDKEEVETKIHDMASKTEEMFNNVNLQATERLVDAKIKNDMMRKDIQKSRNQQMKSSSAKNRQILIEEVENEEREMILEEHEEDRKERHKEWLRKKDEELRRRLMKAYGSPIGSNGSKSRTMKPLMSSTPGSHHMKPFSHSTPRPKSNASSSENLSSRDHFGTESHDVSVQMTEYGLRRVMSFVLKSVITSFSSVKSLDFPEQTENFKLYKARTHAIVIYFSFLILHFYFF